MRVKLKVPKPTAGFPFRTSYIVLPLVILLVSIIVTAFFYGQLPDPVNFTMGETNTERWLSRASVTFIMVVPQLLLTLMGTGTALAVNAILRRWPPDAHINAPRLIGVMGNMPALPQTVLCFAMLDVFSYNSYRIILLPLWAIGLVTGVVGTVILGFFLKSAIANFKR